VEKYVASGQAKDGIIVLRMCFACFKTKPTNTQKSEKYYVIRTVNMLVLVTVWGRWRYKIF